MNERLRWKPITDCRDENGNDTSWGTTIFHNGHRFFIWIDIDGTISIGSPQDERIVNLRQCKNLNSAKRWVTTNIDWICFTVENNMEC